MRDVTIDLGEIKVSYDPEDPEKITVTLHREDCYVDTEDYWIGETEIVNLEKAIALFKTIETPEKTLPV